MTSKGDQLARRNAVLLAGAQALYGSGVTIIFTLGALAGLMLAENKALATLPLSIGLIGVMMAAIPASALMQKVGRRAGFITGTLFGLAGAGLAVIALIYTSFVTFCVAMWVSGIYQSFSQFYRFAAADTASESYRPKAISWVMAGGVIAAFAGPKLAVLTKDMLFPYAFAGAFATSMLLALCASALLMFLDIPRPDQEASAGKPRPFNVIARQPRLLVSVFSAMTSYALMTFVMVATPLAMIDRGLDVSDAAFVIQWHVVAMFLPSFFTGHLIVRFGVERIVIVGLVLLASCGVVALTGVDLMRFTSALVLLGLGWNFSFIGATTMLTDCYRPEERGKVQGINDFLVFGTVAIASLASGAIFQMSGWNTLLWTVFPFVLLALVLVLWLMRHNRDVASAKHG